MVTMTEVAKYAKVSKMTVSRVLSGNGYVKEETRIAVQNAIQALGYRPNLLAKSLVTGRTNVLAYVLPDICVPFFGNVCRGVTAICEKSGFTSIVSNVTNAGSIDNFLNMVIDRKVDGVIFHHLCITQEQIQLLLDNGIPSALIDNECELKDAINVANENYSGAAMVTEYLISLGYQRIVCVHGGLPRDETRPDDLSFIETFQEKIWNDRTRGCIDALHQHGLEPFGMYWGRGSAFMAKAFACGQKIAREILAQAELPDPIYCESDMIDLGVLSELLELKISVPQTIALSGHDGLDTCRFLYPRITTVVQPQYEIGRLAARSLISTIEGNSQPQTVSVPSTLFLGDTTA